MLFSIDQDTGDRIIGWLMPDNPSTTPRIVVHLGPEHHVTVEAFVYRPLLKEQGLHNTGICGFVADESNCPGVAACPDLEIRDADNNVLIYRRPVAGVIEQKFLRLETQLLRQADVDNCFFGRFQMPYRSLELLSEETMRAIFSISFSQSLFASGRIFWRAFEPVLREREFRTGILLRDPFEEMAERLLILKWASGSDAAFAANVLPADLQTCVGHIRDVDLGDSAALDVLLAEPADELRRLLFNPLVYQLAAPNAFDPPPHPSVAAALDSLAALDAVGLREDVDSFFLLVGAVLDLSHPVPPPTLEVSPTVVRLAGLLREVGAAQALISHDLALYAEARRVLVAAAAHA